MINAIATSAIIAADRGYPFGSLAYYNHVTNNQPKSIVELVRKIDDIDTARASNINIVQKDGTMKTFGLNEAALVVGSTMVVAGESTNEVHFSQDALSVSATGITLSSSGNPSPDGLVGQDLRTDTSSGAHYIKSTAFNSTLGELIAYTIKFKPIGYEWFQFSATGVASGFLNINTNTLSEGTSTNQYTLTSIEEVLNGYLEVKITILAEVGVSSTITFGPMLSDSGISRPLFLGDASKGMLVSHQQIEKDTSVHASTIYSSGAPATLDATIATYSGFIESGVLWPSTNFRVGLGEAGKDIDVEVLTPNAVLFKNGNNMLYISASGDALIAATGPVLVSIPITDIKQAYMVHEDGILYAEANGVRGVGETSDPLVWANTFTIGSDGTSNHFEGTPKMPTFQLHSLSVPDQIMGVEQVSAGFVGYDSGPPIGTLSPNTLPNDVTLIDHFLFSDTTLNGITIAGIGDFADEGDRILEIDGIQVTLVLTGFSKDYVAEKSTITDQVYAYVNSNLGGTIAVKWL